MGGIVAVALVFIAAVGLGIYLIVKFATMMDLEIKRRRVLFEKTNLTKQGIHNRNTIWSLITFGKSHESLEITDKMAEDILKGDWDLVDESQS